MKKFLNVKTISLILAVILLVGGAVGGTLAWIIDSKTVTNTFTYGDINITLDESDVDDSTADKDRDTENTYKMVPGNSYVKDPLVTVLAGSEPCWVFVKLEESARFDSYLEYGVIDGWKELEDEDGVYYVEVTNTTDDVALYVLEGNTVKVKDTVTKKMLTDLGTTYPTLKVTAYAVQMANINTAKAAWDVAKAG